MFAEPASASGDRLAPGDIIGHLLIVRPIKHVPSITTTFGEKDGIRADVVVLTQANPETGQPGVLYSDILWLQGQLIGSLKSRIGQLVLGRMSTGAGKPGQKPPFVLESAVQDPAAVAAANAWIAAHPEFNNIAAPATPAPAPTLTATVPAPLPVQSVQPVQPVAVADNGPARPADIAPEVWAMLNPAQKVAMANRMAPSMVASEATGY